MRRTETQRPMKRGSTLCLAATLHIPGDGSAKSAGRSIFSSSCLFSPLFLFYAHALARVRAGDSWEIAANRRSRRSMSPPHVSVSGLCLFLGGWLCGARKPSPAGCFDLGECAMNVNEGATFFPHHDVSFCRRQCASQFNFARCMLWDSTRNYGVPNCVFSYGVREVGGEQEATASALDEISRRVVTNR